MRKRTDHTALTCLGIVAIAPTLTITPRPLAVVLGWWDVVCTIAPYIWSCPPEGPRPCPVPKPQVQPTTCDPAIQSCP